MDSQYKTPLNSKVENQLNLCERLLENSDITPKASLAFERSRSPKFLITPLPKVAIDTAKPEEDFPNDLFPVGKSIPEKKPEQNHCESCLKLSCSMGMIFTSCLLPLII